MARGFGAGENRIRTGLKTPGRGEELEIPGGIAGRDGRSMDQIERDAREVEKAFDSATLKYFSGGSGKGFGASEEATKVSWMPSKADLPSSKQKFETSTDAANADVKAILKAMPADLAAQFLQMREDERLRQEKNIGNQSVNGVNANMMKRIEAKYPDAFAAFKDIAARKAVAASADLKKEIEELRKDDKFDDFYGEAWKAATKAFSSADEVAKMVLKKGDETYGEAREYVSADGTRMGEKESVAQLRPGEPSVSGRVIAVNSGILMARRAAEDAINSLAKTYAKVDKKNPGMMGGVSDTFKNDVLRLVTEKMISDKGAFLQVRGYIAPTSQYVGPVRKDQNPVQHINPFGDFGY